MKTLFQLYWLASLIFAANVAAQIPSDAPVPAGDYQLDPLHTSVVFKVSHLGFSMYTARFTNFDAQLQFDPEDLESSELSAQVDAGSLETDFPNSEEADFDAMLKGADWLDVEQYPEMRFVSTSVEQVGEKEMRVEGDFTMHGVTQPLTLNVHYNGGYAGHEMEPNARAGFSASGTLKRADYGMDFMVPPEGTSMGVGNEVQIIIETEFTGPAWEP